MGRQLTRLERRESALEAVALRRDMTEAQTHINRLQRRYLSAEAQAAAPQAAQRAR
jgi:hypothetical protein